MTLKEHKKYHSTVPNAFYCGGAHTFTRIHSNCLTRAKGISAVVYRVDTPEISTVPLTNPIIRPLHET